MGNRNSSLQKALAYFFLGILGLGAILTAVIYLAVIHPLKSYISPKPFPLAVLPVSKTAERTVRNKAATFFQDQSQDSLVMDYQEINHLLRTNPRIAAFGVDYHVTLQDSLFNIKCTAPLSYIQNPLTHLINWMDLEGFVNAEVEGYVRLRRGELHLISTRAHLGGHPVPFGLLGKRTHIDISKFFQDQPQYKAVIGKLEAITIRNGRLIAVKRGTAK